MVLHFLACNWNFIVSILKLGLGIGYFQQPKQNPLQLSPATLPLCLFRLVAAPSPPLHSAHDATIPFPISFVFRFFSSLPQNEALHAPKKPSKKPSQDVELATTATTTASPSSAKTRPSRNHKHSKENDPPSDPNLAVPSPTKFKSPLPPRPLASNPLKRKLAMVADALTDSSLPASSDSGVKVIVRMRPLCPDKDEAGYLRTCWCATSEALLG
ncbi:hypothetical protein VIGAN_03175600 [Vigna angularis var. angularis]|uniref:Kinesin motor domain-containing protein n=1 Tax=Vigna angularis var. angularis TaxID=157739 RepID=A0A0S3RMP3_PHAAN|nr:hypothetical protein VIGAN_03175600 [Vigna angularis var. angularis]